MVVSLAVLALSQFNLEGRLDALVRNLTLEQKVSLTHGANDFDTVAFPELGMASLHMSDGPHGVRGPKATAFPTGVCLASTFDPALAQSEGVALGEEARANDKNMLLGPAINIVRTPLDGRAFEYMSEDPYLVGQMASGYI